MDYGEGQKAERRRDHSPERIGPYSVITLLASGEFTTVHLAQKYGAQGFYRLAAIKRLKPAYAQKPEWSQLLVDEARMSAGVQHANIVDIIDVGTDAGCYIVMDYIEGIDLEVLLARAGKERHARYVVPPIVDALHGLHSVHTALDELGEPLCMVHQAPRPRHILVGIDGTARITDFSQAAARGLLPSDLRGERLQPGYMAPEQVLGQPVDARTDLFIIGVTLWEALTGERLFQADTPELSRRAVLERHVPKPSEVGLKPPRCFDAICLRALQRNPEHRYGDALEMARELRDAAMSEALYATSGELGQWVRALAGRVLIERRRAFGADAPSLEISIDEVEEVDASAHPGTAHAVPVSATPSDAGVPVESDDDLPDEIPSERTMPAASLLAEPPPAPPASAAISPAIDEAPLAASPRASQPPPAQSTSEAPAPVASEPPVEAAVRVASVATVSVGEPASSAPEPAPARPDASVIPPPAVGVARSYTVAVAAPPPRPRGFPPPASSLSATLLGVSERPVPATPPPDLSSGRSAARSGPHSWPVNATMPDGTRGRERTIRLPSGGLLGPPVEPPPRSDLPAEPPFRPSTVPPPLPGSRGPVPSVPASFATEPPVSVPSSFAVEPPPGPSSGFPPIELPPSRAPAHVAPAPVAPMPEPVAPPATALALRPADPPPRSYPQFAPPPPPPPGFVSGPGGLPPRGGALLDSIAGEVPASSSGGLGIVSAVLVGIIVLAGLVGYRQWSGERAAKEPPASVSSGARVTHAPVARQAEPGEPAPPASASAKEPAGEAPAEPPAQPPPSEGAAGDGASATALAARGGAEKAAARAHSLRESEPAEAPRANPEPQPAPERRAAAPLASRKPAAATSLPPGPVSRPGARSSSAPRVGGVPDNPYLPDNPY